MASSSLVGVLNQGENHHYFLGVIACQTLFNPLQSAEHDRNSHLGYEPKGEAEWGFNKQKLDFGIVFLCTRKPARSLHYTVPSSAECLKHHASAPSHEPQWKPLSRGRVGRICIKAWKSHFPSLSISHGAIRISEVGSTDRQMGSSFKRSPTKGHRRERPPL